MKPYELSSELKDELENESMEMLRLLQDIDLVVIGGWAVRGILSQEHARHTFDVDGVATEDALNQVYSRLQEHGFRPEIKDWGVKFWKKFRPNEIEGIEIRLEMSLPRIMMADGKHYFEFNLKEVLDDVHILSRCGKSLRIRVPKPEYLVANKLGYADWKNIYDVGMLQSRVDIEKVVGIILSTDNWKEVVLRKISRFKNDIRDQRRISYPLLVASGVDLQRYSLFLTEISNSLR